MLIDEFMPHWHFGESHTITIDATQEHVFEATEHVTPGEIRGVRLLMGARGAVGLIASRRLVLAKDHSMLTQMMMRMHFVLLGERRNEEIVVGIAGRFWRPTGGIVQFMNEAEFEVFSAPGNVKAVVNFHLAPEDAGIRLTTETRVHAVDDAARAKFARYWLLIRPFSGLIRRSWLQAIKRRAESA